MTDTIDQIFHNWGLAPIKKRMFGGYCWLLNGNMACASLSSGMIIVRVPESVIDKIISRDNVYQAELNGRIMKNWAMFESDTLDGEEMKSLLAIGREFALSLPAK